jgi:MFS family permease
VSPDDASADEATESILGGRGSLVLAVASGGWLLAQVIWYAVPALLPAIIDDLGISPFRAGIALSAMTGTYALAQYPSGEFSDHLNRTLIVSVGIGVLFAGTLLLSVSVSFVLFVVATVLIGIGKGFYSTSARALITDYYVTKRGQALGVFTAGTDLGGAVASGVAVVALGYGTWRSPFPFLAGTLVVVAAALYYRNDDPLVFRWIELDVRETVGRLTATRQQRGILLSYALLWFVVFGFVNFLPTMLQAEKNLDVGPATSAFTLLFLVGAVMKPLGGTLSDKFPRKQVGATSLLLAMLALAVIQMTANYTVILVGIVCFAIGYKPLFPIMEAYLLDTTPDASKGADLGTMLTATIGAGSLGPMYVGFVAEQASYTAAFASLVVCLFVSAVVLYLSS